MRFDKRVFMGLALAIGMLAGACAPGGPSSGPGPAPVPQLSPTPMSTPSPAEIEAVLTRIAQYDQRLKQLAANNPSPDDLVNTLQDILTLMDYVTAYYPQMSPQQRTQALNGLTGILGDEVPVVNTQARVFRATATAFAAAYPTATTPPGTQTPVAPSPQATLDPAAQGAAATAVGGGTPTGASVAQQITADLDAIRNEALNLASDQPTNQDIVNLLGRIQADLSQLSQQSSSMPDSDVVSVLAAADRAVAYLVPAARTLADQQNSSIATPTPPSTSTPPPSPSPSSTSTSPPPPTSTPGP